MSNRLVNNQKKKKICLVNPTIIIRRPLKEMAPLLVEKGYEVGVMIPKKLFEKNNIYSEFTKKNKKILLHEYAVINTPFSQFEWPIPLLKFWFLSFKILLHYDVVQIWSNFYLNNFLLILLSYFFPRTKIILTMDTVPGYSFKSSNLIDWTLRIYTKTLCKLQFWRANKITLYGKSLLPYAKKAGLPLKKTIIVPTGLTFYKRPTKQESFKQLSKLLGMNLSELKENKIVSFIGLMNDRKGVDIILKVAKKFKKEKILFLLLGTGLKLEQYQEEINKLNLNKIKFLGYNKTIKPALLEVTTTFFFPSRGEGLAGVIMEAMYQEATILTTRIPGTIDLIKDEEEGLLVEIDDEKGFEKELRRLLEDDDLRKKLEKKAAEKIKDFDWKTVLKEYEEVY